VYLRIRARGIGDAARQLSGKVSLQIAQYSPYYG